MSIQRMAGDIKTKRLLFRRQHLSKCPGPCVGQVLWSRGGPGLTFAKKIILSECPRPPAPGRSSNDDVDPGEEPSAPTVDRFGILGQRIKGSAAHQTLEDPFVNRTFLDSIGKIRKRLKPPGLSRADDGVDASKTNALNCRQTVTNRTFHRSKANIALVNIRRQEFNSLPSHFPRITKDLGGVLNFVRKDCSVEMFRIVRL